MRRLVMGPGVSKRFARTLNDFYTVGCGLELEFTAVWVNIGV